MRKTQIATDKKDEEQRVVGVIILKEVRGLGYYFGC